MSDALRVLIVEDDPAVRRGCQQALQLEGIAADAVDSAEAGWRAVAEIGPAVVITDIRLPGMDGMALMRHVRALDPDLPVVLMTGHGDIQLAVQAMKEGAQDFIEKPFSSAHLVEVARRALEKRRLVLEVRSLRERLNDSRNVAARLIGNSASMQLVRRRIADVGATSADVLVLGETGTGKELAARCLHEASPRRDGNFVAINCGGLPESLIDSEIFGHEMGAFTGAAKRRIGKIEHANGGTLFLDEIESMPLAMQIKLLRVLQERTLERLGSNQPIAVDCRVIAATKVDLKDLSAQGSFRADLYYRLAVATIPLPPLRERRDDIGLLFEHFAELAASRYGKPMPRLDSERLTALMSQQWPGNVRELRNAADRWVLGVEGGLPVDGADGPSGRPLAETMEAFERSLIAEALRRNGMSLARTAEDLRMAKTTLFDKIRKYGLAEK
ncbi:MAG: sigma-54 dependent transcriptional regulator [Ancalomicrobiaceae bacterium]|nr:sigma-54 dependent transcriptional regulator [Ancalomicrobiaceae bacterium]